MKITGVCGNKLVLDSTASFHCFPSSAERFTWLQAFWIEEHMRAIMTMLEA